MRDDAALAAPGLGPTSTAGGIARALRRRRRLRAGILQLLYLLGAVALGFLAPQIDVGFTLPGNRVIELLLAVAAGTVTFIGLVFSLLFLVAQFGSSTYTPRLSLFRDSPVVWHAFAFFTGVIVYAFAAVLAVGRADQASGLVPILAALGVLGTVALYRVLQMRAFRSIQLGPILAEVERRGRRAIDDLYVEELGAGTDGEGADVAAAVARSGTEGAARAAAEHGPPDDAREVRWARPPAVLQVVDVPRLLHLAERAAATIELRVRPGAVLFEDSVVATVRGGGGEDFDRELRDSVTVGFERTTEQDAAFALRILADVCLRGISPAVNDPSTAVQSLDATESLLRRLARRRLDIGRVPGADGTLRVVVDLPDWDDYLAVACDEVIACCAGSPMVTARMRRMLDSLAVAVPAPRRDAVERRLHTIRVM